MKLFCVILAVALASQTVRCDNEKVVAKRSTLLDNSAWDFGWQAPVVHFPNAPFSDPWSTNKGWPGAEARAAVAAAKSAAEGVKRAQLEAEAARTEAIHHQKFAAAKEAAAAAAIKNSEELSARARSEAVMAANAAVRAAASAAGAGARVAAAQREAARRESHAAEAIQAIAAHAAAHISNADIESAKIAANQRSEAAAAASKVAAAREASLAPLVKPFYHPLPLHTVALPIHW